MSDATTTEIESWHWPRLVTAWVVAAILAALVVTLTPEALRFEWMVLAIGICTLVTFGLQLGTAKRAGFIMRLSLSVVGSVTIICAVAGVAYLVSAARL